MTLDRTRGMPQADREGRGLEMAEAYGVSALAAANQLLLEAEMANPEPPSPAIIKELRTRRATNTNFLFALKTILKVTPQVLSCPLSMIPTIYLADVTPPLPPPHHPVGFVLVVG